jgi:Bacterial Ig-like domain (group 2)
MGACVRAAPRGRNLLVAALFCSTAPGCGSHSDVESPGPILSFLQVTPEQRVVRVGDTFSLGLIARDASGNTVEAGSAQWTSSDGSVVSVRSAGQFAAVGVGTARVTARAGGLEATATLYTGAGSFNLGTVALPQFVVADHHDLANIYRISRFRSGIGHSNGNETIELCRNLKHYYEPIAALDWTTLPIASPVTGTLATIEADGLYGVRLSIIPRDFPPARIVLHHVAADPDLVAGAWLEAGQHVGTHSSQLTYSDISVLVVTPTLGERPVSLFDVMSDAIFAHYQALGVPAKSAFIISREERDADPIPCTPDLPFPSPGHIENWVYLH